mgnify:CR=1 FL=1
MRRRRLLAGAAGLAGALPLTARAQQARVARVGVLITGDPEPSWSLFRKSMAALGHVEDRTVRYVFHSSDANREKLAGHANYLVSENVDVIVAILTPAILAARKATTKIPIVFSGGVPETGTVRNLARPEGNLTGIYGATAQLAGKSIQLFREIKPTAKSIGVLLNAPDPFHIPLSRDIEAAGKAERIEIISLMLEKPQELDAAFASLAARGVDGVAVQPSLPLREAALLALRHRLPALSYRREFAELGGLLGYGANQPEIYRVLARYTDRVLKGAQPADLPVKIASRFDLVVNQKTAKAMGLSLPPIFLARADEVIE